jgi:hypothetical protein
MTLSNPNLPSAERLELSLTASSQPPISDAEMRQAVRTLLIGLGEDPDREGLLTTFYPSQAVLMLPISLTAKSLAYLKLPTFAKCMVAAYRYKNASQFK